MQSMVVLHDTRYSRVTLSVGPRGCRPSLWRTAGSEVNLTSKVESFLFVLWCEYIYSMRRRGGRGLAYILYVRVHEQVHLTHCRDFFVSEARATSKLWNWLFKHHTTPFWATCIYILARTLTCDASIYGPTKQSSMHACMHHFDLHQERLINFTINEDSSGLYIYYGRSI